VTRAGLASYLALLLTWNERINLTGARTIDELVREHLPDAFALAGRIADAKVKVADVGSGGGLPAIPLLLLQARARVVMFEPIAKKTAFLRTAVRELGLGERAQVEARRVDAATAEAGFDVAISRAALPPKEWLALARHLVIPGGRVFVLAARPLGAQPPPELDLVSEMVYLGGHRRLVELRRST